MYAVNILSINLYELYNERTMGMKVGIIGAGTMGSGIAQVFAQVEGNTVYLCDIKEEFAANGKKKIEASLKRRIAKGKMTEEEAEKILSRVKTGLKDICTDVELIVEVAPEVLSIKHETFLELQNIVPKDCIFASNTSSLSVTDIGHGLDRPVVGMHFFNPAPAMKLVEVIKAANAPDELCAKVIEIAKSVGKTPVHVNEAAGFIVNRLLIPMINEAIDMYALGVASVEEIDTAMKLGANHPMGPFELGDTVGLDICLQIMQVIYIETGDQKYRPSVLLKNMVRAGKLGRKTGIGFYDYSEKK